MFIMLKCTKKQGISAAFKEINLFNQEKKNQIQYTNLAMIQAY